MPQVRLRSFCQPHSGAHARFLGHGEPLMPFEQNCHDPICFRKITLAENKEDRCEGGSGGERERSKARGPVKS